MKLIIDIPDHEYKYTCERTLSDRTLWDDAIRKGTPLDDVKAEIEQIYQEIDTCSHNEYENAVEQGKEIAYENVLDILDNIGKAESVDT